MCRKDDFAEEYFQPKSIVHPPAFVPDCSVWSMDQFLRDFNIQNWAVFVCFFFPHCIRFEKLDNVSGVIINHSSELLGNLYFVVL